MMRWGSAPELSHLAPLDVALALLLTVLHREHQTLAHDPEPYDPRSLKEARRLAASIDALRRAMRRYTVAAESSLGSEDHRPF